ncbi:uncharacterized protein F4822DRAFT_112811 [Hypoxylon trugodes]|uniref:uncharacterized protein n=1 Tax=Hypoxylon trugodes TaxID=326681 RepID=UPI002194FD60|nr:uncharacterized protein F4822DRAFT_112811 [Hypoxylon trugodes]KAI1392007.1 hypothetical protein F4822DRAFT_112811 [Hypoxylon trugodes]
MEEEPTLPKLPAVSWDSDTQTFTNTRKRARDQSLALPTFNNSSDPAIFSSDDDPSLENYTQNQRRKKRYVGSWFQQHPTSSDSTFSEIVQQPLPKTRRTFRRQFDSGVWLGSDNSVDMEEDSVTDVKTPVESKLLQLGHVRATTTISSTEANARQVIQDAIDKGTQVVNLTSFNIETISNATISQISLFDTIPLMTETFPIERKQPSIEVYLASNPLIRVPGALFNLENLTVLSLRNTKITELPSSIRNLRNLDTLNVSLTRLRYLPWELTDLLKFPSKLRTLNIHPNPFYQPDELDSTLLGGACEKNWMHQTTPDELIPLPEPGRPYMLNMSDDIPIDSACLKPDAAKHNAMYWQAYALARTPVQYNDVRGFVVSTFRLSRQKSTGSESPSEHLDTVLPTEDICSAPAPPPPSRSQFSSTSNPSRVPSLLELALQSCAKSGQLRDLPSYLPHNAPSHLLEILERIAQQSEEGGNCGDLPCSVCGRRVTVPMVQWIEWWEVRQCAPGEDSFKSVAGTGENEQAIPFLRWGCSWKCVPSGMIPGQRLPGTVVR